MEDDKPFGQGIVRWFRSRKFTISDAIVGAALTLVGVAIGNWTSLVTKDHELKIRLVEIGIGVLRAEPKEGLRPAREWAIEIIEQNTGKSFSPEAKKALIENQLPFAGYTFYSPDTTSLYFPDTTNYVGKRTPGQTPPMK